MATIAAAAAGNWSATATWIGGVVPGTADDVYANGFTVTINQNITVLSLRTTAGSGIAAGGGFNNSGNFSVTATGLGFVAGTTACLNVSGTGVSSIVGDSFGGTVATVFGISITGSSSAIYTGNTTGGSGSTCVGLYFNSIGTLTSTGTATGGSGSSAAGLSNNTSGTVNHTGSAIGGGISSANGINNAAGGTVNITGNVTGGTVTNALGVNNAGVGTVTLNGSAFGAGGIGANNNGTGTMRVTRAVATTGTSASVAGVAGFLIGGTTIVKEIEFGTNGQVPLSGFVKFDNAISHVAQIRTEANTNIVLTNAANSAGLLPAASNVRAGTVYNSGTTTGTLAVPIPANVRIGVATDNTVGTAALTPADIRAELAVELARIDASISSRLPTSGYTAPVTAPTAAQIRTEIDTNSTKLANLDATVSSRASQTSVSAIPTTPVLASDTRLNNLDATVSSRLATSGYTAPTIPPTAAQNATAVRTELAVELGRVDAAVSSRLATTAYTAPANSDITVIKAKTDQLSFTTGNINAIAQIVADKTGYSITSAERTAIAVAVEQSILNDGDGQAVLNAIVGAIANTNIDQIALVAAIRSDIERIGGMLATRATQTSVSAIPTNPVLTNDTRLNNLDASISSRLAIEAYTVPQTPPTTAQIATAVWSSISRTLTSSPSASPDAIAVAVWNAVTRTLTSSSGSGNTPTATEIISAMETAFPRLLNVATVQSTGDQLAAVFES